VNFLAGARVTLETINDLQTVVTDPLLSLEPLPYRLTCYPLGFPMTIATNSEVVLDAARASWGRYPHSFEAAPFEARVLVSSENFGPFPPPPRYRGQGHLLSIVSTRDNHAVSDFNGNFAYCWLEPQVVAQPDWMRHHFLEGFTYATLSCRHLAPVHAAAVMKHGRGLLLHGPSGAGKSSLAYACARAGWIYASDDVCFLRRALTDRMVLGKPHQIRFLPSAVDLFPELAGRPVIPDAVGQPMMTIDTETLGAFHTAWQQPADAVVFLNRGGSGKPAIRDMDRDTAFACLMAEVPFLTKASYEQQQDTLRNLLRARIVELEYSDLDSAVTALDDLVAELGA
jgi:hypothetical protein